MNQKQLIGKKIRELRKDQGLSAAEFGKMLKPIKKEAAVTSWERGRTTPDPDILVQICKIFHASLKDFYSLIPYSDNCDTEFVDIPIYGAIAAGTPIEMLEIDGTHPVPYAVCKMYPGGFLLRVEGESMNRILPNGCYAYIVPCDTIDADGQPYAVCVNGYDATIKRVRKLNNGFELVPDSTDPTYAAEIYNYNEPGTETITVIGRVVYYVLPFDWSF